jgi:hypothetical protein
LPHGALPFDLIPSESLVRAVADAPALVAAESAVRDATVAMTNDVLRLELVTSVALRYSR